MSHKYNLYYAMIFEMEELNHRGRQVFFVFKTFYRLYNRLNHLLSFKDATPNCWYNFSLGVPVIAPIIAKAALD